MIKIGYQKPKITFVSAHNDMSHFTPSHYTTNDFFYLSLNEYMEKLEFDQFDMGRIKIEEEALKCGDLAMIMAKAMETTAGQQMDRLIKKAHGQLWQFNAVSKNLDGYVRQVVILGERQLVRWTWFDAYVKLPLFEFVANTLNRLRKYKTYKEIANWEAFLNKMHKKTS